MRHGRRDDNHAEIIAELRQLGYSVLDLGDVGGGCPDLCVGAHAKNFLFELKDPSKPPSKRKLTPDQKRFFASWKGQIRKVEGTEEILHVIRESYVSG